MKAKRLADNAVVLTMHSEDASGLAAVCELVKEGNVSRILRYQPGLDALAAVDKALGALDRVQEPSDRDLAESFFTRTQPIESRVCPRCNTIITGRGICSECEQAASGELRGEPKRPRTICAECRHLYCDGDPMDVWGAGICLADNVIPDSYDHLNGLPVYGKDVMICRVRNTDGECPDYEAKGGDND